LVSLNRYTDVVGIINNLHAFTARPFERLEMVIQGGKSMGKYHYFLIVRFLLGWLKYGER
jgi:hypothetical protein